MPQDDYSFNNKETKVANNAIALRLAPSIELTIDPSIRDSIPSPTQEERAMLEESIQRVGCNTEGVILNDGRLLDGFVRYAICQKLAVEFRYRIITDKELEQNGGDPVMWRISHHFSQRNLQERGKWYIIGKAYLRMKQPHGGARSRVDGPDRSTAKLLSKRFKVSEREILRCADFASAIDRIKKAGRVECAKKILSKDLPITKDAAIAIGKIQDTEKFLKEVDKVENGVFVPAATTKQVNPCAKVDLSGGDEGQKTQCCPNCNHVFIPEKTAKSIKKSGGKR